MRFISRKTAISAAVLSSFLFSSSSFAATEFDPDNTKVETAQEVTSDATISASTFAGTDIALHITAAGSLTIKNNSTLEVAATTAKYAYTNYGTLTIEAGSTFIADNSAYPGASSGEYGVTQPGAKLNVYGNMNIKTPSNRPAGLSFDVKGTANIYAGGKVRNTGSMRICDKGVVNVWGTYNGSGLQNGVYNASLNIYGTHTIDTKSAYENENVGGWNFVVGGLSNINNLSAVATVTVYNGGTLNVDTNAQRSFYMKTSGSKFIVQEGGTANFNDSYNKRAPVDNLPSNEITTWYATEGTVLQVDGKITHQTNNITNRFQLTNATGTIGSTGSIETDGKLVLSTSASLTVNGSLYASIILQEGNGTVMTLNKGSDVTVAQKYLFQGLGITTENVLNLYTNIKKEAGGLAEISFASANGLTINVGDGVSMGEWNMGTVVNNGTIKLNLAENKSQGISIESFLGNSGTGSIDIDNFENYYIEIMNISNLNIEDDKLIIGGLKSVVLKGIDQETDIGYTTGWSIDELDGHYFLNNSNFPIPEPSEYAAIFGALALVFVFFRRRK